MVIVTDKEFNMDKMLKEKLDLCINRSTGKNKMDNLLIIDGDEGFGKSTMAMQVAYYVAHSMNRTFSLENVFFNIDKLIDFTKTKKEQIIVWDEAALGGLSTEWRSKSQTLLTKLLMTVRKHKHFMFFCIPKFYKLNEYIFVERAIGLIHVYARNEIEIGRFCYYNKKKKENLWDDKKIRKQKNYRKYYSFHGSFPNVLAQLIDEKAYDKKKDKAIMSIGATESTKNVWRDKLEYFKYKISQLPMEKKQVAELFDVSERTVLRWQKTYKKTEEFIKYA